VLSIDITSVTPLEEKGWRPFSGIGQALLGAKPEEKKWDEEKKRRKRRKRLNKTW